MLQSKSLRQQAQTCVKAGLNNSKTVVCSTLAVTALFTKNRLTSSAFCAFLVAGVQRKSLLCSSIDSGSALQLAISHGQRLCSFSASRKRLSNLSKCINFREREKCTHMRWAYGTIACNFDKQSFDGLQWYGCSDANFRFF